MWQDVRGGVRGFPGPLPARMPGEEEESVQVARLPSLLLPVQGLKLCLDSTPQDSPCHLVPGQKVKK